MNNQQTTPSQAAGDRPPGAGLRDLTQQAWELLEQNTPQAIALAQQALDAATEINDQPALAFSRLILGAGLARQGDFQAARQALTEALPIYQAHPGFELGNLRLLSELGWCLLALGDDAAALELLERHATLKHTIFSRDTSDTRSLAASLADELRLAEQRRLLARQRVAASQQAKNRAARLLEITRLVWEPASLRANLPAVAAVVAELCGACAVSISLVSPENGGLAETYAHHAPPPAPAEKQALAAKIGWENTEYGLVTVEIAAGGDDALACRELVEAVARQISVTLRNERLQAAINRLSTLDPLTGIYNRRYFLTLAQQELKRTRRYERPFSILLMDLDHFKLVNDEHGLTVGDEVLSQFAQILRANLRETDVLARYGGEEFILLLPETGLSEALGVAGRLLYTLRASPCQTSAGPLSITMSIGVAGIIEQENISLDQLLERADKALYQSKKNGRNRVTVWLDT